MSWLSEAFNSVFGGGGGSNTVTTIQNTEPWDTQKQYLTDIFGEAQDIYNSRNLRYGPRGLDRVAGFTPQQRRGFTSIEDYARQQGSALAQTAQGGITDLIGMRYGLPALRYDRAGRIGLAHMEDLAGLSDRVSFATPQTSRDVMSALARQNTGVPNITAPQHDPRAQQAFGGFMTNPINPYTDMMAESALNQMARSYAENVLPNMRHSAQAAGQYGGSRQDLAEAQGGERLMRAMGDTARNIYGGAYETGQQRALQAAQSAQQAQQALNQQQIGRDIAGQELGLARGGQALQAAGALGQQELAAFGATEQAQAQRRAQALRAAQAMETGSRDYAGLTSESVARGAALAPGTQQMGFAPGQALLGIGGQMQAQNQAGIDDRMAAHQFAQAAEQMALQDYAGMVGGNYGMSSMTQNPYYQNRAMGALGGALSGGALGSMLGYGSLGPWAIGGAVLGGLF